jgi:sugar-specific transcriptional regulator TrmB
MSLEDKLRLFGLNKYEALAYVELVRRGVLTSKEISDFASIPYPRVYDVLTSLERKGWIVKEPGKPMRYRAVEPARVLKNVEMETRKKLEVAKEEIINELKPLSEDSKKVGVWIIRGKEKILEKVMEMINSAEVSLSLLVPFIPADCFDELSSIGKIIESKAAHGVEVRVVAGEELGKIKIPGVKVRVCREKIGWVAIKDEEEVFYASPYAEEAKGVGMWSDEPELVKIASVMFKYLWEGSEEL